MQTDRGGKLEVLFLPLAELLPVLIINITISDCYTGDGPSCDKNPSKGF